MNIQNIAEENKILEIVTGSHLYGTNIETSDKDYVGIFIAPIDYYLGLNTVEEVDLSIKSKDESGKNNKDAVDKKLYELRKFVKLAIENNPNILEILFVNDKNIIYKNEYAEALISNADKFVWQGCAQKFLGYAFAQKHKMKIKPVNINIIKRCHEFFENNIHKNKLLIADVEHILVEEYSCEYNVEFVKIGDLNIQRNITLKRAAGQLGERISKFTNRDELITKYGYDTKFAMHLIRLMMEGKELLQTGRIEFPLKEAAFLKTIRNGEYSCEQIIKISEDFEKEIEYLKTITKLPSKPRFDEVNELLIKLIQHSFWK